MSTVRYHLFVPKITASNTGAVKNDGGVPSILSGLDNSKPAPGVIGRIYIATDTKWIYRDNGTSWDLLGTNAVTVNNVPVGRVQASTPDQITDQIVVTPAEEIRDILYNPIPLMQKGSLTNTLISNATDIAIRGNYMYLAVTDKLVIVDISNPAAPVIAGSLDSPGINRLDIQGAYLYAVNSKPGYGNTTDCYISCIDISDPSLPSLVRETLVFYNTMTHDIYVLGSYLYVTYTEMSNINNRIGDLRIYDINTMSLQSTTTLYYSSSYTTYATMAIKGDYLYVGLYIYPTGGTIDIYNIADKSNLIRVNRVSTLKAFSFMKIQGNYLYAIGGPDVGIEIYDITNPSNPIFKGSTDIKGFWGLDVSGNYAYVTGRGVSNGTIYMVDISNPVLPEIKKNFTSPDLLNAGVVGVQRNYVYAIANGTNKIMVFG